MKWLVTRTLRDDARRPYQRWLARAGIVSEWIGPDEGVPDASDHFAALLLTGGGDVSPDLYGQPPSPWTKGVNRARDLHEIRLVREFFERGRPVWGICRGLQILNVALGGGLIQHLPDVLAGSAGPLEIHEKRKGLDARHPIICTPGTRLAGALAGVMEVNSAHHQAVDPQAIGRGLRVVARSPAGVIEAVEGEGPPVVMAVQWHPERLENEHPASVRLLQVFLELV